MTPADKDSLPVRFFSFKYFEAATIKSYNVRRYINIP